MAGHTNKLIHETSPYLLQHAHNPVEWNPWGPEALDQARSNDKPILLSIGYSACHWCHVMERESFENESIAAIMNRHFINIKVDREERPDLDQIYMNAVQLMTGSGGWPLTVFLLPTGEPFYGGTYFPPDDRYGRPGFGRLLETIADAYRTRRSEIAENVRQMVERLNQPGPRGGSAALDVAALAAATQTLASRFDPREGGFGAAPKFPPAMPLDFLLRYDSRVKDSGALHMVELTLDKMAHGGMYDQVGGGFHRYSVDDRWLVPHFEKMLYDNALLARVYLDAWRVTGKPLYRRIVEETLDYIARDMRDSGGGFYSSEDADSEGVEGKFYVWTLDEFTRAAGDSTGIVARFFDVTEHGNWEHHSIPNIWRAPDVFAKLEGVTPDELSAKVEDARRKLFVARLDRVRPGRDDKMLTDWNGLTLRAFADGAAYLGRADYREIAEANARFIMKTMWNGERLLHSFKDGRARFNGYLDDYANFADGLLALYQLTFDAAWLRLAESVTETMIARFWDREGGGFFFTSSDHETLITRTKDLFDNAVPAGNSVAADVLLRLAALLQRNDYRSKAEAIFASVGDLPIQYPTGFGRLLAAMDFAVGPSREVAIAGGEEPFVSAFRKHYLPRTVIAAGAADGVPLLAGRDTITGQPTAYVCENLTCKLPVTDVGEFEKLL
jgi:uncharacterized protein YyaL (SSP411 family)